MTTRRGIPIFANGQEAHDHCADGHHVRPFGLCFIVVPNDMDEATVARIVGATTSPARATDPDTAHEAAAPDRRIDRARALAILREHPEGLTDDALAVLMDRRPTSAGKRRGELVDAGLVEWTGKRAKTRTGSSAMTWRVIPEATAS